MLRLNKIRFAAVTGSLIWAAACPAQQVRQQALGFLYDGGISRVRPLLGVPGAAVVGDPADLGADVSASATSPNQDFVLIVSGPTRTSGIWIPGSESIQALSNVHNGASQIVISPEGASAAFYYPDTNQVRVVTGLPSAPVAAFDADLSSLMNPLKSLAVSDDGSLLLASENLVDGYAAPAVVVFRASGVAARISTVGPASAIAFLSNSRDVLLSSVSESVLIRDAAAQTSRIELPTAANSASGVIASSDGTRAFFANAQSGTISIFSLKTPAAPPAIFNCDCAPTGFARTAAPSVYRLNGNTGAGLSLLDVSATQPRMLVIPPVANTSPDNQ
jgi:hypothetical protein